MGKITKKQREWMDYCEAMDYCETVETTGDESYEDSWMNNPES